LLINRYNKPLYFSYLPAFIAIFILALALTGCRTIKPEAPEMSDIDIPRPQQLPSDIDIPISIELKNYFKQAENSVSYEYTGKAQPCEGIRYEYYFKRSPFNIVGEGNKINLNFQGDYKIDLSYCAKCAFDQCIVPKISVSCGYGEPLRKIKIGYTSTFSMFSDYKIQSVTKLTTLEPIDRCKMTVFNLDATDRLISYIKAPLNELGAEVDKKVSAYDLKPTILDLWKTINEEIRFGSFGFMNLNPKSVRLSEFNIKGTILEFSLALTANPVLRTKSTQTPEIPLPNLQTYTPGKGFNINLDLFVSYDTLSKYLTDAIKGKELMLKKKKIILQSVEVYGIGNQKIVIGLSFGGRRKGILYLVGTPEYVPESKTLSFPDLKFDVKTKNLIFKSAKWLFNDKITAAIRTGSKYDLSTDLNDVKIMFQKELNKKLDESISSSGEVEDLNVMEIYPTKESLMLRAVSKGNLKIIIAD
jgi:hypothetical protein